MVQDWYAGDWSQPSIVAITLTESNGKTKVELTHENIPNDEYVGIKDGWKDYYFIPLKELVEMS